MTQLRTDLLSLTVPMLDVLTWIRNGDCRAMLDYSHALSTCRALEARGLIEHAPAEPQGWVLTQRGHDVAELLL